MTRNILCAVYLLIAISAVHSASFYYRAGREVIVPTIEEVKEVISELKKEGPVVVEEIVAAVPSEAVVDPVVKSVPVVENVVPVVEAVENNVVADAEKVVVNDVVSDVARSKPNPSSVLRLDTLEVIQPAGEKSDKVVTVSETVKNAAVQAVKTVPIIEPIVQPIVEPAVQPALVPVVQPVVESVDASVKSVVDPVPAVVPVVENVVPAVVPVESVAPAVEAVRSAEPEPAKPEEPTKSEEPAKPEQPAKEEKIVVQPTEKAVVAPEVRQTPQPVGFQSTISQLVQTAQQTVQGVLQNINLPFINQGNRPPQSDAPLTGETAPTEAAQAAPAAAADDAAGPATTAPNLLQSVQQAITQFTNNIIPAQLRPTTAPAAEPPVVLSGSRGSEETVEVVQNIDIDINDKVDLAKKVQ